MYIVCAVRDSALDAFMRPFFVPARGLAIRSFSDEVNRVAEGNGLNSHPDDYELYCIGTFDEDTGRLEAVTHEMLIRGKDCVVKK